MPDTILVVAEQRSSRLNPVSLETIAAAQALAASTGWQVEAVIPGGSASLAEELARYQLAHVYTLQSPQLDAYTSDAYVEALRNFIAEKQPRLVLFPHTYQVRDFAPRLALALGQSLLTDCTGCRNDGGKLIFTRQMFQGKFAADVSFTGQGPWLATMQAGSFRADQAAAGTAATENVPATVTNPPRIQPGEIFRESKQSVDLSQAEIIVSVGRGIKEQKNLTLAEELASVLGAELAASRPICDNGWLPIERQVGSSGQTVAPRLYLALGISGAIQHLVGMKGARTIVAINKDPEAPIFELADYGLVGDLFQIVPALTEELKKAKGVAA